MGSARTTKSGQEPSYSRRAFVYLPSTRVFHYGQSSRQRKGGPTGNGLHLPTQLQGSRRHPQEVQGVVAQVPSQRARDSRIQRHRQPRGSQTVVEAERGSCRGGATCCTPCG